jgi:hypothetical protein
MRLMRAIGEKWEGGRGAPFFSCKMQVRKRDPSENPKSKISGHVSILPNHSADNMAQSVHRFPAQT